MQPNESVSASPCTAGVMERNGLLNSHDSHSYCKRVSGGGKGKKLIGKKSRPMMTGSVITYSKEKMT